MLVPVGTYVRIRQYVLDASERSENIPESTKKVPLKAWVKGYMLDEGELYENVKIKTVTGRIVEGELKEVEPIYTHTYGDFVPEIFRIRKICLIEFWGDRNE